MPATTTVRFPRRLRRHRMLEIEIAWRQHRGEAAAMNGRSDMRRGDPHRPARGIEPEHDGEGCYVILPSGHGWLVGDRRHARWQFRELRSRSNDEAAHDQPGGSPALSAAARSGGQLLHIPDVPRRPQGREGQTRARPHYLQHIDDPLLRHLYEHGSGVWVTVNRTDQRGRKASNIVGIRAVWQEDDFGYVGPAAAQAVDRGRELARQVSPLLADGLPGDRGRPSPAPLSHGPHGRDYGSDPAPSTSAACFASQDSFTARPSPSW